MPLRSIEDPSKLRRVVEAILLIEADLDLPDLLRHVIEEARSISGARYGAIGVLGSDRIALAEFITVGLSPEEEERIGKKPTGLGVLGLLIADPQPLRIANLNSHPDRSGFPPHHPPMTSLLGVPIGVREQIYGNLYLTDKIGWSEFTNDDQVLVEALALAAGIAIENTRLHRRVQETAVHDERDRVARDLHDTVIQRLFGAGLALQSMAGAAETDGLSERLNATVTELDDTIRQIRSTIFELGLIGTERGVRAQIVTLLRDLSLVVGFEVKATFDGPVDTAIPDKVAEHLLAAVREAVTNVGRHAHATKADVLLSVHGGLCRLQVTDDGRGMGGTGTAGGGLGLVNLRRRAEKLKGHLEVTSPVSGGTVLDWQVFVT